PCEAKTCRVSPTKARSSPSADAAAARRERTGFMSTPLPSPERVLPTLNADGSRKRIRPQLFKGKYYRARLVIGWGLIALFAALPFVQMSGKPVVLLDVAHREFTLFGRTFLPTDSALLMLLLLAIFVGVFWITALVGRAWCG